MVDDEPDIRRLVSDTLQPLGYQVLMASCGKEALDVSMKTTGKIDLLLVDVVMPGMNGRELAEALKTKRTDMQIVFMSGYTDNVIVHQGVLQAGTIFINKPLVPSRLASKLREVLDGGMPKI